jgi:hypothetical protein
VLGLEILLKNLATGRFKLPAAVASTGPSTARKMALSFAAFEAYFLLKILRHMPIFQ